MTVPNAAAPGAPDATTAAASRPAAGRTVLKAMVGGVALLLLLSMGGAIVAAPVMLPLLWWAGRSSRPWGRAAFDVLAVLTAAEAAWAVAYVTAGERTPLIWALPVAAAIAVAGSFPWTQHRA